MLSVQQQRDTAADCQSQAEEAEKRSKEQVCLLGVMLT